MEQRRSRPLVPRCAYGGKRYTPHTDSISITGAVVESNVAAEHLATKRSTWFRANADRTVAGRLGQPLWKSVDGPNGSVAASAGPSPSPLRGMSEIRRPASALARASSMREGLAADVGGGFVYDLSAADRFSSVSRPTSAVPRVASASRPLSAHRGANSNDTVAAPYAAGSPSRSRPTSAKPHTGFPAFGEAPRPQSIRERQRARAQQRAAEESRREANAPSRLRSIVQMRRDAAAAASAAEVAELSNWRPRPAESQLFSGAVVGRYRTAVNSRTSHTMWDLALEPPIHRDDRVRAEMAKIFDDPKDAPPTSEFGGNPALRRWDDENL